VPAPVFSENELNRLEANLPTVRDVNLLGQLSDSRNLGRALAREVIAEIKYQEAFERLLNFEKHGDRQALLIDTADGVRTYRRQDVMQRGIFEKQEEREVREKVEAAFDAHRRHLAGEYEKSLAYLQRARDLATEGRRAAGKIKGEISDMELTPAEKMTVEIFAEKRREEGERARYLQVARGSAEYKPKDERRREDIREYHEKQQERQGKSTVARSVKVSLSDQKSESEQEKRQERRAEGRENRIEPDGFDAPRRSEPIWRNGRTNGRRAVKTKTPRAFTKTVTQNQEIYPGKNERHPQQRLREVKRGNPCPVCEKPDWCSTNEDRTLVICKRVQSLREAKNGKGWIHILDGDSFNRVPQTMKVEVQVTQYERADISRRHQINSRLLNVLKLNDRDRRNLAGRGLDDETIKQNGYKSVPTPSALDEVMKHFKGQDLRGIPGYFQQGERWRLNIGEWVSKKDSVTYSFHQGFLIPVRDVQGQIEGFQIRRAEVKTDEPRYIWLSSSSKEGGASSGAPVHFRNPERVRESGQAIITEGALKADTAAHILGDRHCVIALAGVGSFREDFGQWLRETVPELRQVVIAFDADAASNPTVRHQLDRLSETLQSAGMDSRELRWEEKLGKGIDDYLLKAPEHRTEAESFLKESLVSLDRSESVTIRVSRT
jgi:uncharacterized protein DUF3854